MNAYLSAALQFCTQVRDAKRPILVLRGAHRISDSHLKMGVLGVWYFPRRAASDDRLRFISPRAPADFVRRYDNLTQQFGPDSLHDEGRRRSTPFTLTEARQSLQLTGNAEWPFDLLHSLGLRDGLYCPFNRWGLVYTSRTLVRLGSPERGALNMIASAAIGQIERIVKKPREIKHGLTPREVAVLREFSYGKSVAEVAAFLNIHEHTVRTFSDRAVKKLKAVDRSHALCVALRLGIIE
jgi:DNA-binding CsgD family transcriptional regulator